MFKPMLAGTVPILPGTNPPLFDFSKVSFPLLLSPKLDGVRMTVQNGKVWSRELKPLRSRWVNSTYSTKKLEGCDGELVHGAPTAEDCFNATVRALRTDGPPDVGYYVFDHNDGAQGKTFEARYRTLQQVVRDSSIMTLHRLPQIQVGCEADLYALERTLLAEGYEGMIGRSLNSPYKQGRSTLNQGWLLKFKRFVDGEGIVIGFVEGEHNANEARKSPTGRTVRSSAKAGKIPNGKLGALIVRDINDRVIFNIGSGFTEALAIEIWNNRTKYLGKIAKFKSQAIGRVDKPRIPVFKGWRLIEDTPMKKR